jgi:hypothetical protein
VANVQRYVIQHGLRRVSFGQVGNIYGRHLVMHPAVSTGERLSNKTTGDKLARLNDVFIKQ